MEVSYLNDDGARAVRCTDLEVSTLGDVIEEEFQEPLGLLILEADDVFSETLVNVESLLASGRMNANERVL